MILFKFFIKKIPSTKFFVYYWKNCNEFNIDDHFEINSNTFED